MRDGEGAMLVVPVLLEGAVEGFEERLLLVLVVLVGLLLRQVRDLAIRHGSSPLRVEGDTHDTHGAGAAGAAKPANGAQACAVSTRVGPP